MLHCIALRRNGCVEKSTCGSNRANVFTIPPGVGNSFKLTNVDQRSPIFVNIGEPGAALYVVTAHTPVSLLQSSITGTDADDHALDGTRDLDDDDVKTSLEEACCAGAGAGWRDRAGSTLHWGRCC